MLAPESPTPQPRAHQIYGVTPYIVEHEMLNCRRGSIRCCGTRLSGASQTFSGELKEDADKWHPSHAFC